MADPAPLDQDTLASIHAYAYVGVTQRKPGGHLPDLPGSQCETCWETWLRLSVDFYDYGVWDLTEPVYRSAVQIIEGWYTAASMTLVILTPWSFDPTRLLEPQA